VIKSLELSNHRGIIVSGWGGLSQSKLPDNIFLVESVPYNWIFPKVAAVVHHGGAGTTRLAFRCGVPSIVVPFTVEQPFWGRLVARLRVGPSLIPRKRMTADRLVAAITQTVGDREMAKQARELSEKINAEDGVGRAVDIIGKFMSL